MSKERSFLKKIAKFIINVLVSYLFIYLQKKLSDGGSLPPKLTSFINQSFYIILLAEGMLLCIMTSGTQIANIRGTHDEYLKISALFRINIDLAVGSTVYLVGSFAGVLMVIWHVDPYLSLLICLVIATLLGAWQAFWIAYVRIPPLLVTLVDMFAFRRLALLIIGSTGISVFPEAYLKLFNNNIPSNPGLDGFGTSVVVSFLIGLGTVAILVTVEVMSRMWKQRKGYSVNRLWRMIAQLFLICTVIMFFAAGVNQRNDMPLVYVWLTVIALLYLCSTQNTTFRRYISTLREYISTLRENDGNDHQERSLSAVYTKKMIFCAYTNMGFLSGIIAMIKVARSNLLGTTMGNGNVLKTIVGFLIVGALLLALAVGIYVSLSEEREQEA